MPLFVKIFKILTSLLLVALLGFLIKERQLVASIQEIITTKKTTVFSQKNVTQVQTTPLQEELSVSSAIEPNSQELTPENVVTQTKTSPVQHVASTPQETVYVALQEGHSDTDESYKPTISPCKVPMGYRIGRFDTHFGISLEQFKQQIEDASSLWGNEINKKLFVANSNGPLTINLIYDERQARTEDINLLSLEIENSKKTAESIRDTYEQEKLIYTGDGEQLTKDTDTFQQRSQAYTDKVTKYNAQGGAPKNEYDAMNTELASLQEEVKNIEIRRKALLVYMDTINKKVERYNELVKYINTLINKSNSLGAHKFTEGRFTPRNNTIDIYQYDNTVKLRRVITHELGHVLGINHNSNMYSIMYSVNSATTTVLSNEDIASLEEVCAQ